MRLSHIVILRPRPLVLVPSPLRPSATSGGRGGLGNCSPSLYPAPAAENDARYNDDDQDAHHNRNGDNNLLVASDPLLDLLGRGAAGACAVGTVSAGAARSPVNKVLTIQEALALSEGKFSGSAGNCAAVLGIRASCCRAVVGRGANGDLALPVTRRTLP